MLVWAIGDLLEKADRDKELWADSKYTSKGITEDLEGRGMKDKIGKKGNRNKKLSEKEKKQNKILSKTQARVEHALGHMKYRIPRKTNKSIHFKAFFCVIRDFFIQNSFF